MSKTFKKSRFFHLHPETNQSKVEKLEALHVEYVSYVGICVQQMFTGTDLRLNLKRSEKQSFFPKAENLTSHIQSSARDHAIYFVSSWAKRIYKGRMKKVITNLLRSEKITEEQAKILYTIGKYLRDQPKGYITQEGIDLYWNLLSEHGGKKPEVRNTLPMRLSEMTSRFKDRKENGAHLATCWLNVSSLEPYKTFWLPLVGNPYINKADQVSKGILARKTPGGRWRFEAVEKKEWGVPEPKDLPEGTQRIGVDIGLNVLAASSDGTLYGEFFKKRFDKIYKNIKSIRANRQRQGFKENSLRLAALEAKLSGMIKTEMGKISNLLIKRRPNTIFIVEDLDLRGCRGQKRFAYRALQNALSAKAPVETVNPAYTSQECPSCGYISKSNRSGVHFCCRSCGRRSHADWVGASGILRRSKDKDIGCNDHPNSVRATLRRRFLARRAKTSPARSLNVLIPMSRSLTTGVLAHARSGTGSNLMSTPLNMVDHG